MPSRRGVLAGLALLFTLNGSCHALDAAGSALAADVLGKVGPASAETMKVFSDAGMTQVVRHGVSTTEIAALDAVIRRTPRPVLEAVSRSVDRLSFVDGLSGHGTGLTRLTSGPGEPRRFEITLRSDAFTEDLGAMLTRKERRGLVDAEAQRLSVKTSPQPAVRYVLTHEFAHVWENTLDSGRLDAFRAGVWRDARTLASPLDQAPVARNSFRRHAPQSARDLVAVYNDLAASPFVNLYATASASEDFAEATAWAVLAADGVGQLQVVFAGDGPVFSPLSNMAAKRRMDRVSAFF